MSRPPPPKLPAVSGDFYTTAAKFSRDAVLFVYQDIGGHEAFADWARENPDEFYTKMFGKTIQRDVQVEGTLSVEGLLEQLDSGEIVEVDYSEVDNPMPADRTPPLESPSSDDSPKMTRPLGPGVSEQAYANADNPDTYANADSWAAWAEENG